MEGIGGKLRKIKGKWERLRKIKGKSREIAEDYGK